MLSCVQLFCDYMDCNPPGSSVRGISQARILGWVAISFSRGSSRPRDRTHVSCISCLAGGFFTTAPPGKPAYPCHVQSHRGPCRLGCGLPRPLGAGDRSCSESPPPASWVLSTRDQGALSGQGGTVPLCPSSPNAVGRAKNRGASGRGLVLEVPWQHFGAH